MNIRSIISNSITVILSALIIFIVLSQVFAFPSPIAFVATDSMEPTLSPGDGFVGIPTPLAGELTEGDVVTYRAQTIQGGGLTTHRIIDVQENGYITKGDANPVTDQEDDEPIVTDSQIELVALQVDGQVVIIPGVGAAAQSGSTLLQNVAAAIGLGETSSANTGLTVGITGLLVVAFGLGFDWLTGDNSRTLSRSISRQEAVDSRLVLLAILIALSLPVMSVMAIPSGTEELTILSTNFNNEADPFSIEAGESSQIQYTAENNQPFPKVIILQPQTEGLRYSDSVLTVQPGETAETQITFFAPEEIGSHVRARSEHHYIHVLPTRVIEFLHNIHSFIAMFAINSVLLSPIILAFYLFIGFRTVTIRDKTR